MMKFIIVDRWGAPLDSPQAYLAAACALQMSSHEVIQFFESRGLKINGTFAETKTENN